MSIREDFEKREKTFIAPYGCLSVASRGRLKVEEPCPIRTAFQRDRDRIVFSHFFRRLKYKTQVFLSPLGDHYRTRLTHTLEVAQIARTIGRAMRLNEDLVEVIALGHDLGHTPFGHSGEMVLRKIFPEGFMHNEQSLRVVDVLDRKGEGLNLCFEVRDGILKHSKGYGNIIPDDPEEAAATVEGRVVRIADIMAYLNHDLDDAIRSGVISREQVPKECSSVLGDSQPKRAATMIQDLIFKSRASGTEMNLVLGKDVLQAMTVLRQFLYDNVYRSRPVEGEFVKSTKILTELYCFFLKEENRSLLDKELEALELSNCKKNNPSIERTVCDFIASITDRYALDLYTRLFFPAPMI
ncbi:MAG: deoxyguanosinetriphosphate triphosphohydrolase [Proteobacteria bacterium]|nr:deoxyguanosinetriphosphate triphosphohydrolase [Pseudomonadota bacterium]